MKNRNAIRPRQGSALDSQRLEPSEYPRDLQLDFTVLSKGELIELFNCIDLLATIKRGRYVELAESKILSLEKRRDHLLTKARDLTIKKHLDKRGSR